MLELLVASIKEYRFRTPVLLSKLFELRIFRSAGKLLAIESLCFVLFVYFAFTPEELSKRILFYPVKGIEYKDTSIEMPEGTTVDEVYFKSKSGESLHGQLYTRPEAEYVFILNYGQAGNIAMNLGLAKMPLVTGQSVFAYDYEGFGLSSGNPSCKALLDDGVSAYDYLVKERGVKPSKIIVYGVSLGTGVASHIAENRQVAAAVLISPYTSLHGLAKESLPYLHMYPQSMFPLPDMGSKPFIEKNRTTPVFLWHGVNDWVIGVHHSYELIKTNHAPMTARIAKDKNHGNWSINEMADEIKLFIKQLPEQKSRASKKLCKTNTD